MYIRICKHCGKEFQADWYNATVCKNCKKKKRHEEWLRYYEKHKESIAKKDKKRYYKDHELSKRKMREKARRFRELHYPHVDRYCKDCGVLLTVPQAIRCPTCAEERHRVYMRERQRQKRAALRDEKKRLEHLQYQEKKVMDESVARAKRTSVKVSKMHKAMERDARRKEKEEQKRLAASVALLKKIHAKFQREKREEEEFLNRII